MELNNYRKYICIYTPLLDAFEMWVKKKYEPKVYSRPLLDWLYLGNCMGGGLEYEKGGKGTAHI